jgi:HEAT repeats
MANSVFCFLRCVAVMVAVQLPAPSPTSSDVDQGAFSQQGMIPPQLQYSDFALGNDDEQGYAKQLADADAADVIKYLVGPPTGGEPYRALQREVQAALGPEAILRELREGDYLWGTWLAFLRPHKELVPTLLAGLKDKPKMLPETMLALGNSGDPRALGPLLKLLQSKGNQMAGFAAQALGYLGNPDAEPMLIEALATDDGWRQLKACGALASIGTRRALPALEKLAKDDRYTGALSIQGNAARAVASIKKREKH